MNSKRWPASSIFAKLKAVFVLFKTAGLAWADDNAPSMGAALAFYTVFSLAPVLIVVITVAGFAFGQKAAEVEFSLQLRGLLGEAGAKAIQAILQSVDSFGLGIFASAMGIGTLLVGASGAFVELQDALNKIWKVGPGSENIWVHAIRERFLSFILVLGLGFLLLLSFVASTLLAAMNNIIAPHLPWPVLWLESVNFLLSLSMIALLLAMIFKLLPDVPVAWSDVWIGAAVASILLTTGKALISFYLAKSTVASAYGAASSLVIILTWVYYSAQIILFGAEVTHVYSHQHGSRAEGNPAHRSPHRPSSGVGKAH
jgi:membrane protein